MRKYFGTDGIRKLADEFTDEFVYKIARAGAKVLIEKNKKNPFILIGRDTRISGKTIEKYLVAGFKNCGVDVKLLGVIPTPGVAYLTKKLNADAGVMISASHNPYNYNGIKFFSNKGMKIQDELEEKIEEYIDKDIVESINIKDNKIEYDEQLIEEYNEFFYDLNKKIKRDENANKIKVLIDTANGATSEIAKKVFTNLEIKYKIINNRPNGFNINENCGSTHIELLKKQVVEEKYDLEISYDGDGDRCLAVDEKGNIIDGDKLLAIFSEYFKEKGILKNNTVVATVMSNLGLNKYAQNNNIYLKQTKVGDRYVLEEMLKYNYNLGGEQSGHIILLDYNPTGDGILTSLFLIKILLEKKIKASQICEIIKIYPQVLINANVKSDVKYKYEEDVEIKNSIEKIEKEFSNNGRVLIRPSGTENLVRVMIEGEDIEVITEKAKELATLIEKKLN